MKLLNTTMHPKIPSLALLIATFACTAFAEEGGRVNVDNFQRAEVA